MKRIGRLFKVKLKGRFGRLYKIRKGEKGGSKD